MSHLPAGSRRRRARDDLATAIAVCILVAVIGVVVVAYPGPTQAMVGIAQLVVSLFAALSVAVTFFWLRHRSVSVEDTLRWSASRDAVWDPESLRQFIAELFPIYWQSRARGRLAEIADCLSAHHLAELEAHAKSGDKVVGGTCSLDEVSFIGMHDRCDDRMDRFEALIKCASDIHRVTRLGELREGFPTLAPQHQRWQFVRSQDRWLLNGVGVIDVGDALRSADVVVDDR